MSLGLYVKSIERYEELDHALMDDESAIRISILPEIDVQDVYWGVSRYVERGPYRITISCDFSKNTDYEKMVLHSIVVRYDEGKSEQLVNTDPLPILLEEWSYTQGRREGIVKVSEKRVHHTIESPLKLDFGTDSYCTISIDAVLVKRNGEKDELALHRKFVSVSEFKICPFIFVVRSW